ncbi:O-antigen ligase family protein [Sphingomonas jinjuensis]|nr:O-antigen ligase family protein [Sphingomonas jinjuensis]
MAIPSMSSGRTAATEPRGPRSSRAPYWLFLGFMALVALTGGTSRYDSVTQVLVRSAALAAMAGWVLLPGFGRAEAMRWPFVFLALIATTIAIQLIPLPPGIWTSLAGHEFYASVSTAAGLPVPWRPINLSPERGWSAFFSLVVPLATLVGLSRMSERRRLMLVLPLIALVLVSAVLGLGQLSGGASSALRWYEYSDPFAGGFFANRNHQAALLAMVLPLVAVWAMERREDDDRQRYRGAMAAGIGAFVLLMIPTTGSRAGFVLSFVSLIGALVLAAPAIRRWYRRLPRRRRRTALGFVAGAVVVFVVVAVVFGRNDSLSRLQGLDATQDLRARTLPTVIQLTGNFFPIGSGIGSFDAVYRRFEPFNLLSTNYLNLAHNDFVQVVMEAGIAGAALIVLFIGWWLLRTVQVWRAPTSAIVRTGRAGSIIILLALAASAVDYPLRTALMMMVFTIAAVWLEQAGRTPKTALLTG